MSTLGSSGGYHVTIDLPRLLETRMLVQANSGSGKSWALRRLLEQTATKVQQLVIDPEGEFATLREKHDFVICAPHDADAVATPQTAALLARRLLESGVSAILDIYDLKAHERTLFVRRFLEALINAPKTLWHPVLIVLDEAHIFAPQVGSAESLGAVIDVATRGRKRGQCLVAATQRLSKLHKDVAAEMLNKLVGRTGLDVDVKRAADELGMGSRDAMESLRHLEPGQFFAFGSALTTTVQKIDIGPVHTTHPKSGQRLMTAPPAPSAAIRAKLAELADLQKDAEEEARTVEQLRAEVTTLKGRVTRAEKAAQAAGVPEGDVQKRIAAAVAQAERPVQATACGVTDPKTRKALEQVARLVADALRHEDAAAATPLPLTTSKAAPTPSSALAARAPRAPTTSSLSKAERLVLTALAQYPDGRTKNQVAILTGYAVSGGGFNNAISACRSRGYLEGGGERLAITGEGLGALGTFDPLPHGDALLQHWYGQFSKAERGCLEALVEAYPKNLAKTDVAAHAGYEPNGGGFNNALSRLRTLELISGRKDDLRAAEGLFG